MSAKVEFPNQPVRSPSKGSAGLSTHAGGCCTTVSALMEYSKASGNKSLVRHHIG
ncbi:MAG: hypothetical protein MJZ12_01310 [Prevotella sp.]|nr:hypothetical protein [Prevotella sp.]